MTQVAADRGNRADPKDPRAEDDDPRRVVRALRALGHPLRFSIVGLLAAGDVGKGEDACGGCDVVCATRLRLRFGVSAPDLTHHMKVLQEADLVEVHREGVWVRYELRDTSLLWLASAVAGLASDGAPPDPPSERDA